MLPDKQIPQRPVTDNELHGCTVLACSLLQAQEIIEELKALQDQQRRLFDTQICILKAFGDLYAELTDESERRRFLSRAILRAEREAARTLLPLWFWRPEQGLTTESLLKRRARFLIHEHKAHLDDVWDLLVEFGRETSADSISDEQLSDIIEAAHTAKEDPTYAGS